MLLKKQSSRNLSTSKKIAPDYPDFFHDSFCLEKISEFIISGERGVDFIKKQSYLDKQARKILYVPSNYIPSLKDGYHFYAPNDVERASHLSRIMYYKV